MMIYRSKQDHINYCFVFWPNGEQECFVVNPGQWGLRGLTQAMKWLEILSLNQTFVRASVATNRLQTLTSAFMAPYGRLLAVRICGSDNQLLASVAVFGRNHDSTSAKAALSLVANDAAIVDLEALHAAPDIECGIAIATFGPKTDAAVDEAYGIGLCLGAAMNQESRFRSG